MIPDNDSYARQKTSLGNGNMGNRLTLRTVITAWISFFGSAGNSNGLPVVLLRFGFPAVLDESIVTTLLGLGFALLGRRSAIWKLTFTWTNCRQIGSS